MGALIEKYLSTRLPWGVDVALIGGILYVFIFRKSKWPFAVLEDMVCNYFVVH